MKGHEYCPIKNRCSSKPCPLAKPLCYPDFAWNSHTCRDGVWGQWGPWSFCTCPLHALRTRACQSTSGGQALDCGPGPSRETSNSACPKPEDSQQHSKALGMEDGSIPDSHITASTYNSVKCLPHFGRLHRKPSLQVDVSWCSKVPGKVGEFLQVNLGSTKTVTKIATQGRYTPTHPSLIQFVIQYSISYSTDGSTWENYCNPIKIFQGNTDANSVVTNHLPLPITAQHIRVIVKDFYRHPSSMRIELYGY
ncbi:lactadherin [Exaiptasia diaphana]|uniref:F5/8 type C domain-containing protein n=1 Tax=Exaiptasia diaphana TaxID=2652724 RepID=A0A913XZA7_EXADI|nr:lactadherin [Exaiptasia diaphana]